eukprot:CAMPEP_0174944072 /NCGR_PEP_ID=MMETSP1355-20121228/78240_1 /TAXON_ID=464990 /ORGANISM="Hemiselmis tepida, Strain CCMP443" /LENGTH=136 /DNA_ID=CAMNT_0016191353 /DNA_START=20 /DNA_END=427 /DNA_ORIENTATION=-
MPLSRSTGSALPPGACKVHLSHANTSHPENDPVKRYAPCPGAPSAGLSGSVKLEKVTFKYVPAPADGQDSWSRAFTVNLRARSNRRSLVLTSQLRTSQCVRWEKLLLKASLGSPRSTQGTSLAIPCQSVASLSAST